MKNLKSLAKRFVKLLDDSYHYIVIRRAEYVEIKKCKPCWENVVLTDAQKREVQKVYGPRMDMRWHRYFQYFTGKFDAQYLPDIVFSLSMECKLNPRRIARELEDKARIPIIYGSVPDMVIPKTIVLNTSGICYDGLANVISGDKANELVAQYLAEHEKAVFKPTRETGGGKGVVILDREHFSELPSGMNYIVQECIVNQEDIRVLNPATLNTIRVITYICDGQYWCAPLAMSIGSGTSRLDNICTGGICIGIKENGELCSYAYREYSGEKYAEHPYTGIKFEGYKIQNIDKVINAAIDCHKRTPHMRMASWDFALDKDGRAVLIEVNLSGQSVCFPQYTHGKSLFGKNTSKMLEIRKQKWYL